MQKDKYIATTTEKDLERFDIVRIKYDIYLIKGT